MRRQARQRSCRWRRGTEGSEQSPQSLGGVENFSTRQEDHHQEQYQAGMS